MIQSRSRDVAFRMNGSLVDMEDLGCPGEWQNDMSAGIQEIWRLRTALAEAEARVKTARNDALDDAAKVAADFNGAKHAAYDMKMGIFPKQSYLGDAIATAIRALKDQP